MSAFVGRAAELKVLEDALGRAAVGEGSCVLISGEAGIGKTRLIEEAAANAKERGFAVLRGACSAEGGRPFLPLAQALGLSVFEEDERVSFDSVLVVGAGWKSVAVAPEGKVGGALPGTLSAVQEFAGDALGDGGGSLGRLDYGDRKMLLERTRGGIVVAVFTGTEHKDMRPALAAAATLIGERHGEAMESWDGTGPSPRLSGEAEALAARSFLVPKNFEGVKLTSERNRIADRVLGEMSSRADGGPLLLILEDMHWADASTVFVLEYLVRNIAGTLAVLATARTGEGGGHVAAFERLAAEGAATELDLGRLSKAGVAELLSMMFSPNDFPADFADRVESDWKGNPFFTVEALKQMAHEGGIVLEGGSYRLAREGCSIPPTVEGLVQRRLSALGPESLTIAEYASCMGREFTLGAALSIGALKNPAAAMDVLKGSGIVNVDGSRAEFAHAYFQSVLYANISQRWKLVHHRSLGEHYEREYAGRECEAVFELARHFTIGREHVKAFLYSMMAADAAASAYAPEQAVELYGRALDMTAAAGEAARERVAEIRERLGDLHALGGRYAEALASYEASAAAASGEERARAIRKRAKAFESQGDYDSATAEISKGIEAAGASPERWRLDIVAARVAQQRGDYAESLRLCQDAVRNLDGLEGAEEDVEKALVQSGTVEWLTGKYDAAMSLFERALEMANRRGSERARASILLNVSIIHCDKGEFEKALGAIGEALAINKRARNQNGIATSHGNIGVVYQRMGDNAKALDAMREARDIYVRIGDRYGLALSSLNIGIMLHEMGDLAGGEEMFQKARELGLAIGHRMTASLSIYMLGALHQDLGDLDKAMAEFEESLKLFMESGDAQRVAACKGSIASVLRERGEPERALTFAKDALDMSVAMSDMEGMVAFRLVMAEIKTDMGAHGEAIELCAVAGGMAEARKMDHYSALSLRVAGTTLAATGNRLAAEEKFLQAQEVFDGLKAATERAKTMLARGENMLRSGERERGRELLSEALAFFETRKMAGWAEKARKALGCVK